MANVQISMEVSKELMELADGVAVEEAVDDRGAFVNASAYAGAILHEWIWLREINCWLCRDCLYKTEILSTCDRGTIILNADTREYISQKLK